MEYNQHFIDTIEKQSTNKYNLVIKQSMQELICIPSPIFKKNNYWYQYKNWNLPESGKIKEWDIIDKDNGGYKILFSEKMDSIPSRVVFNVEQWYEIYPNYQVQHVDFSLVDQYLVLVVKNGKQYDILVIKKYTTSIIFRVENISLESGFYICNKGIIFGRTDNRSRPDKIFYLNFTTKKETLVLEEKNKAYRLKIINNGNGDTCFIQSSNFKEWRLFLFLFKNQKLTKSQIFPISSIIHKRFSCLKLGEIFYFVEVDKKGRELILKSIDEKLVLKANINLGKTVKEILAYENIIVLNVSDDFHSKYYILTISQEPKGSLNIKRRSIIFDRLTTMDSSSFADQNIIFKEQNTYFTKHIIYDYLEGKIINNIKVPILSSQYISQYHMKTIWTKKISGDVKIPISIFWKGNSSEIPLKKKCIVYAYGAYGKKENMELEPAMYSIINSGFLYAIVHVRGGGYLGGKWYRAGKKLNKWNSINDLINGVKYLVSEGIIDRNSIGLVTSSAGGIIAGATLNKEKTLFKSMLLFSPFINPYDSLHKKDNPLSITEIEEWGDIQNKKISDYILSYSPMQNIEYAKNSNVKIITLLGENDPYINNQDVLCWSQKLNEYGYQSIVHLDNDAGHGGLASNNEELLENTLNYFLEQVERDNSESII
ncbi:prolyl oligopeptidase family serine peptidase [Streptococcus orisasini]|uniref:prolyl oligopeptidase family serine peptidase n=1 Tax=Streptococcus orisasini TaxID=1080071 RepID=UPI00070BFBDD|nr:prolyl oligopeptidase family serine peptidase [Streptococcus orisasini]